MTQVNLLPPELRRQQATRRTTVLVAGAGVVVLLAIGFFYFLQTMNLSTAKDDLAAQQSANGQVQSQVAELQKYSNLQAELQTKQSLLTTVFTSEVSWSAVLRNVSRVIPSDEVLTAITGQLAVGAPGAPPPVTGPGGVTLVGSITFSGTVKETGTLATWLTRLETVKGWANAWASTATESEAFSRIYDFTAGIDLTNDALTQRGRGGQQ